MRTSGTRPVPRLPEVDFDPPDERSTGRCATERASSAGQGSRGLRLPMRYRLPHVSRFCCRMSIYRLILPRPALRSIPTFHCWRFVHSLPIRRSATLAEPGERYVLSRLRCAAGGSRVGPARLGQRQPQAARARGDRAAYAATGGGWRAGSRISGRHFAVRARPVKLAPNPERPMELARVRRDCCLLLAAAVLAGTAGLAQAGCRSRGRATRPSRTSC